MPLTRIEPARPVVSKAMEPSTYEAVPPNIADKVLEEYTADSK